MKKFIMMAILGVLFIPSTLQAQDLEKPKDCGSEEFDAFKNKAFGISSKTFSFRNKIDNGEKFTVKDIEEVDKLKEDLAEIKDKTADMVANAKKAKPMKTKMMAVKNTNTASNALKIGGENLKYITENMVKAEE